MKLKQLLHNPNYTLLTYLLIGFHFVANTIWITLNKGPSLYDAAWHTVHAYQIADYIKQFPQIDIFKLFEMNTYHPPLVFWGGAITALVTNYSENGVRFIGTISLALSFLYLFKFASVITNQRIAFFSTLFCSLSVFFYRESRMFMLDIPLVASIFAVLYYLHQTTYLTRIPPLLKLGITLGIMMLIKWTAIVFILPICFWYIWKSVKKSGLNRRIILLMIGIVFGIAAFLALPWYLHEFKDLVSQASLYSKAENDDPFGFGSDNLLYYFRSLVQLGISFSGLLLLIYSIYTITKKRIHFEYTSVLITTIIFAYSVFTFFVGNKNGRYLLPLIPFLTILMSMGVDYALNKWRERVVGIFFSGLTIGYLVLAFFVNSFAIPFYPKYEEGITMPFGLGWVNVYLLNTKWEYIMFNEYPDIQSTKAADILIQLRHDKGSDLVYFTSSLMPYFQEPTIAIQLAQKLHTAHGGVEHLYTGPNTLPEDGSKLDHKTLVSYISKADVVFLMEGQFGYSTGDRSYLPREQIQKYVQGPEATQFCLADRILVNHVYKNKISLGTDSCK
jgi:4-amino-4-deoxy-L-arabinose transferase-like glycosyltransferase